MREESLSGPHWAGVNLFPITGVGWGLSPCDPSNNNVNLNVGRKAETWILQTSSPPSCYLIQDASIGLRGVFIYFSCVVFFFH